MEVVLPPTVETRVYPTIKGTEKALLGLRLQLKRCRTTEESIYLSWPPQGLRRALLILRKFPPSDWWEGPHPDWLEGPHPDWSILAVNSGDSLVLFGAQVSVLSLACPSGHLLVLLREGSRLMIAVNRRRPRGTMFFPRGLFPWPLTASPRPCETWLSCPLNHLPEAQRCKVQHVPD